MYRIGYTRYGKNAWLHVYGSKPAKIHIEHPLINALTLCSYRLHTLIPGRVTPFTQAEWENVCSSCLKVLKARHPDHIDRIKPQDGDDTELWEYKPPIRKRSKYNVRMDSIESLVDKGIPDLPYGARLIEPDVRERIPPVAQKVLLAVHFFPHRYGVIYPDIVHHIYGRNLYPERKVFRSQFGAVRTALKRLEKYGFIRIRQEYTADWRGEKYIWRPNQYNYYTFSKWQGYTKRIYVACYMDDVIYITGKGSKLAKIIRRDFPEWVAAMPGESYPRRHPA